MESAFPVKLRFRPTNTFLFLDHAYHLHPCEKCAYVPAEDEAEGDSADGVEGLACSDAESEGDTDSSIILPCIRIAPF